MSRLSGFFGALVAAALIVGASEAVAGGQTVTPRAITPGCGAQAGSLADPGGPARSLPADNATAASNWTLHGIAESVDPAYGTALLAVDARSSVVLARARSTGRILVRATTDAGASWTPLAGLGKASWFTAAGDGSGVDVLLDRSRPERLLYVRSADGGRTWSDPVRLGQVSGYGF